MEMSMSKVAFGAVLVVLIMPIYSQINSACSGRYQWLDPSHKESLGILLVLLIMVSEAANGVSGAALDQGIADVLRYGAIGDGKTDDTLAFAKAWNATCNSEAETSTMSVPKGKAFFVQPSNFTGPCKSNHIYFRVAGIILGPNGPHEWNGRLGDDLLTFKGINGLTVNGSGSIDGRGKGWWDMNCKKHEPPLQGCVTRAPTTMIFQDCRNVSVSNINLKSSPQTHILVQHSQNVSLQYFNITSPGDSPNTDGVHLHDATAVLIQYAHIRSGDDCISVGDYTSHITISDIFCGPGHGISIGSLGLSGNEAHVEDISVQRAHFFGTTNGLRIKTYQTGKGSVQHVSYVNITFSKVENPIIIDQHYCFSPSGCQDLDTAVHINNVSYIRTIGTSASQVAVNFNCSKSVACTNITLDTIKLIAAAKVKHVTSNCDNAYGFTRGTVFPTSCLK